MTHREHHTDGTSRNADNQPGGQGAVDGREGLEGRPGTPPTRYVLDRDGDLWRSTPTGRWECLTTKSCTVHPLDLVNVCGPLTELLPTPNLSSGLLVGHLSVPVLPQGTQR
jgi:hypothetical protein